MMEKMVSIKSNTLKYARNYYDVSISEVSEKTKIKAESLECFENGTDFPSYAQLEKLANYYNRAIFFFFTEYIPSNSKAQIAFRKVQSSREGHLPKHTRELIEKAELYRLNLVELYEEEAKKTFVDLVGNLNNYEEFIPFLRKNLDLTLEKQASFQKAQGLLEYLRDSLYNIGIYVFKDSFKDDSICGLCLYDDEFPIILINNKTTFTRQLFTVMHEVFHIFLRETDIDYSNRDEEAECNRFASDFLIPADDLLRRIKDNYNLEDDMYLKELANYYNVSKDAVMYKLVKIGRLDRFYYDSNRISSFRYGNSSGGNFYNTRISYLGNSYLNKIFNSYYEGKISKSQVGMFTGLKTAHVSKLASKMFGGVL